MVLSKLKEALEDTKISVEHLADKAGISSSTVFKAKQGQSIHINTAKRIASALRINLEQLIQLCRASKKSNKGGVMKTVDETEWQEAQDQWGAK